MSAPASLEYAADERQPANFGEIQASTPSPSTSAPISGIVPGAGTTRRNCGSLSRSS